MIYTNRALFIVERNKEKQDEICLHEEAYFSQDKIVSVAISLSLSREKNKLTKYISKRLNAMHIIKQKNTNGLLLVKFS